MTTNQAMTPTSEVSHVAGDLKIEDDWKNQWCEKAAIRVDASERKADTAAAITDKSIYGAFCAVASAALSDAAAAFSSALAARA
jgi:hypothetical protein